VKDAGHVVGSLKRSTTHSFIYSSARTFSPAYVPNLGSVNLTPQLKTDS
jgi:hypothetical protein